MAHTVDLARDPSTLPEVVEVESSLDAILAEAETLAVKDDDGERRATDLLATIKNAAKQADKARVALVKPLNDHVGMINTTFKNKTGPLGEAESKLKARIVAYRRACEEERRRLIEEQQERERLAEEARQREQAAAAETREPEDEPAPPPPPVPAPPPLPKPAIIRTDGGSAVVTKVWKHKVVDPAKIPREYLIHDDRLLRQAVQDGVREIPGVEIYQDDQVSVRT